MRCRGDTIDQTVSSSIQSSLPRFYDSRDEQKNHTRKKKKSKFGLLVVVDRVDRIRLIESIDHSIDVERWSLCRDDLSIRIFYGIEFIYELILFK